MAIVGRFAPSPTGLLHFGSLLAATASYLAARQAGGRWLLRIEDIDRPREQPGAATSIIRTLAAYGFVWDDPILYQNQRLAAYQAALGQLQEYIYPCTCSRKSLQSHSKMGKYGLIYPNTCRDRTTPAEQPHAIRVRTHDQPICFTDSIQGTYCQRLASEVGDFVVRRADGLFAYQLAVVVDDAYQGVNQVVRGMDLLNNTPRQIYLQQLLGLPQPSYAHIPLALNAAGQKLSKQNLAPPLPDTHSQQTHLQMLVACLRFLNQPCPDASKFANLNAFWNWAIANWDINRIKPNRAVST